jgi:hypothetical protein
MITVEKLFDDGEDVLGSNPDVTFLHIIVLFSNVPADRYAKSVPKVRTAPGPS